MDRDTLHHWKEKLLGTRVTRSWVTLAYLYLLLPAVLFLPAWLLRDSSFGVTLGVLFHNYGLFAISVIPNLSSFTGLVGLGLAVWLLASALRRRDWPDFALSAGLVACNALYFLMGWNYIWLQFLNLQ